MQLFFKMLPELTLIGGAIFIETLINSVIILLFLELLKIMLSNKFQNCNKYDDDDIFPN